MRVQAQCAGGYSRGPDPRAPGPGFLGLTRAKVEDQATDHRREEPPFSLGKVENKSED